MKKYKEAQTDDLKKNYVPPLIETDSIEMENGIAAGSAKTVVTNSANQIQEQDWDTENGGGDITWP